MEIHANNGQQKRGMCYIEIIAQADLDNLSGPCHQGGTTLVSRTGTRTALQLWMMKLVNMLSFFNTLIVPCINEYWLLPGVNHRPKYRHSTQSSVISISVTPQLFQEVECEVGYSQPCFSRPQLIHKLADCLCQRSIQSPFSLFSVVY